MREDRQVCIAAALLAASHLSPAVADPGTVPDLSGVWSVIQHDRPGGAFGIPREPPLSPAGQAAVDRLAAQYDFARLEPNASCVEPGMPTVMFGIGGAAMEIVQQPGRITLLSELVNQVRRIHLDGREFPEDFPTQRVGYSIGRWEGATLVIETRLMTEWYAPRWPHSDQLAITERWTLADVDQVQWQVNPRYGSRPPPQGQVLVNEMSLRDPLAYANDEERITIVYRRQEDGVIFEDNCSEGIWWEALEAPAD